MGVDIRLHTEISYNGKDWQHSGGFRPDRDYAYFGLLSDGIRGSDLSGFAPRGLPADITAKTLSDWGIIYESHPETQVDVSEAFKPSWFKSTTKGAYYPDVGVFRASYLSLDEFSGVVHDAQALGFKNVEYEAILDYMRKLSETYQVRVIYFFDS